MNVMAQPALAALPPDVRTLVFGIGAQKAATTWLHRQLYGHPEVHMSWPKELQYWNTVRPPHHDIFREWAHRRGEYFLKRRVFLKLRHWRDPAAFDRSAAHVSHASIFDGDPYDHRPYVRHLLRGRKSQPIVGEITPEYALLEASTFAEMAALHGDTRFVFIMRDPVARLWSGVRHRYSARFRRGGISHETMVRAFVAAALSESNPDRQRTDYGATLAALDAAGVRERVLPLFFETMFEPGNIERLRGFIGLTALEVENEPVFASAKAEGPLPAEAVRAAREALASIYDFVGARFGDEAPRAWLFDRAAVRTQAVGG